MIKDKPEAQSGASFREQSIQLDKTAVLCIDMQNGECAKSLRDSARADRSLNHKISGIHFLKGSWEARVIDETAPAQDDIVIPPT